MDICILIAVASIAACILGCVMIGVHGKDRQRDEGDSSSMPEAKIPVIQSVCACLEVVCGSLDCAAGNDKAAACRNHRKSVGIIDHVRNVRMPAVAADRCGRQYIGYMADAAEMIAETVRHIVTLPGISMTIAWRCEILTLREDFGKLLSMIDYESLPEDFLKECEGIYELTGEIIDIRTRNMAYEDFDDGTSSYRYMKLMCELRLFVRSLCKVMEGFPFTSTASGYSRQL